MPLLNFMPQFVEPIRSGRKSHTIRAARKIPVKVGDRLYLYTGLRHKGAERILPEPVTCTRTQTIRIQSRVMNLVVEIDGEVLDLGECARLAVADGFPDFTAFHAFWERVHGDKQGRVNFTGQIIHWRKP
jgi:hypothetical protein